MKKYLFIIATGLLLLGTGCQKEVIPVDYEAIPDAPTGLSAKFDDSKTFIKVTWEDNSVNKTGFELERSVGNDIDFQLLANLSADVNKYNDSTVTYGNDYYYRIRVKKSGSISEFTKPAGARPANETIRDFDGNIYKSCKVGNQIWMSSNMKTTHYADGTPIPEGSGVGSLDSRDTSSYWFVYDNDSANQHTYGLLYTSGAVLRGSIPSNASPSGVQGICPDGWHVPSNAEWDELAANLGGMDVAGGKMKESGTSHWTPINTGGSDEVGFTALPGGFRLCDGRFVLKGSNALFWTSGAQWQVALEYVSGNVKRSVAPGRTVGLSVRCVKNL